MGDAAYAEKPLLAPRIRQPHCLPSPETFSTRRVHRLWICGMRIRIGGLDHITCNGVRWKHEGPSKVFVTAGGFLPMYGLVGCRSSGGADRRSCRKRLGPVIRPGTPGATMEVGARVLIRLARR